MKSGLPTALIFGIENFVAQKLAEELTNKSINVIGVGNELPQGLTLEGFEYRLWLEEVVEETSYVFDFVGSEKVWEKAKNDGGRLTIVMVNKREISQITERKIEGKNINWRLVEIEGVYGKNMEEEGFLAEAFRQAASNQNLILPNLGLKYRVLAADEAVEAILRASFLSGTEGERFLVVGNEVDSEEVARVMIEEAKMTRFKVMQKEIAVDVWNEEEIEKNWRKLRWSPKLSFKEGAKETMQYFLSKIDDENRKGVIKKESKEIKTGFKMEEAVEEKTEERRKMFDVIIEEEGKEEPPRLKKKFKKKKVRNIEKKEDRVITEREGEEAGGEEEGVGEPWRREEIEGVEIKNANLRLVQEIEDEEEDEVVEQSKVEIIKSEERVVETTKAKKGKTFKLKWRWLAAPIIVMLLVLLSFPISWLRTGWRGYKNILKVENLIKEKKFDEAEKMADLTWGETRRVEQIINDWGVNSWVWGRNFQSVLRVEKEVAILGKKAAVLSKSMDLINEAVFQEKEIFFKEELDKVEKGMVDVENQIGVLQARLGGDWSWLPARYKSWPQKGVRQLEEIKQVMGLSKKGIKVLPEFLGLDGKRREYLVLLQNEMELRPGGGFIGSYGILSFEDGKLLNLEIKDIYEADGQLKGHVEPPPEIKMYLGEAGWYMRDANWDPNFVRAAKDILWFLEKETGRKVDGVIGVDLAVARRVLEVTGELFVPDFREKINKDNLYEQAEFYAETKFFPGSSQKASFLGGLGKQLFEEIKNMKNEKKLELYKSIVGLLESNDIQIALNEKGAGKRMAELGWDGSLYQGRCGVERCLADYLYIVEANLGVNKANYFLYRNIEQMVEISQNGVTRVLKINYENKSKSTNWPGGDYKNYLRVYLPGDINLAEISITDPADPNKKEQIVGEKLMMKEIEGKRELGMLAVIPVGTKRTVEIRYSTSIDLTGKNKFSYLHYIQRQPGFGDTGLVELISYPKGWQPVQVQPAASLVGEKLLFNLKLDKDIKMGVEIGK